MKNSNEKEIKTNNKFTKIIIAVIMIMILILGVDVLLRKANIDGIEGYMYSLASDIVYETATDANATSSNATSSNATDANATSCDATSSNVTTITEEDIHEAVEQALYNDYTSELRKESYEKFYADNYEEYYNRIVDEKEAEKQNDIVTFLEDNKIYVIIIGIATLTAIITGVILIVDKLTKKNDI